MKNHKIISVESRKGGVGKTTVALNIGYLLKDKCHVLLLDIDITGTSIKAVQESRSRHSQSTFLNKKGHSKRAAFIAGYADWIKRCIVR